MPDLSDQARKALAYWPQIEFAARYGMTTADLWNTIRDAAEGMGLASPGVTAAGVSELRGLATGIQRSEREFAAADPSSNLGPHLTREAPWSRDLPSMNADQMFQVRFEHTVVIDGEEQTVWRTAMYRGHEMPATVGDLQDLIDLDAEEMAGDYEQGHVGVGAVQIIRV